MADEVKDMEENSSAAAGPVKASRGQVSLPTPDSSESNLGPSTTFQLLKASKANARISRTRSLWVAEHRSAEA
jgi:hypothetical protein